MVVDVRAHLDLLDLDDLLVLAGFSRLLLGGVFQLAEIENLGDRRIGIGRNLDEVQPDLFSEQESLACSDFAAIVAVGIDELDTGNLDVPVSARPVLGGRCCFERSANGRILLELLICGCGGAFAGNAYVGNGCAVSIAQQTTKITKIRCTFQHGMQKAHERFFMQPGAASKITFQGSIT
ncbi:hypothetical protein HNR59_000950 [Aquamicrobium lusatiense]|uniref:Uncharacterized protein n=1 Tax=Aquamicrobium lusatiense TaxID=89772 RepID=A0A7W9S0E7_9HYPH|nr:hypothetical protein [Aquamicrobium lusatiense]